MTWRSSVLSSFIFSVHFLHSLSLWWNIDACTCRVRAVCEKHFCMCVCNVMCTQTYWTILWQNQSHHITSQFHVSRHVSALTCSWSLLCLCGVNSRESAHSNYASICVCISKIGNANYSHRKPLRLAEATKDGLNLKCLLCGKESIAAISYISDRKLSAGENMPVWPPGARSTHMHNLTESVYTHRNAYAHICVCVSVCVCIWNL